MGGEAFHGKQIEVGCAVLVGEVACAVHGVSTEVVGSRRLDDSAVAVDELKVEVEVGAVSRGSLAHPKRVVDRVVGTSTKLP